MSKPGVLLRSLRYTAQSSVRSVTRIPTADRSAAMPSATGFGVGKYEREMGGYHRSSFRPLPYPAAASS